LDPVDLKKDPPKILKSQSHNSNNEDGMNDCWKLMAMYNHPNYLIGRTKCLMNEQEEDGL
jgi:hypothetical protein